MTDKERPKARVIGVSSPRKAVVVKRPEERQARVRVVRVSGEPSFNNDAVIAEFVRACREHLVSGVSRKSLIGKGSEFKPNDGLFGVDIEALVRHLDLSPAAFIRLKDRAHWDLVVEAYEESARVYDPTSGVGNLPYSNVSELLYVRNQTETRRDWAYVRNDRYSLLEEPLRQLGPIQRNAIDCGTYCVYGAKVAKGK